MELTYHLLVVATSRKYFQRLIRYKIKRFLFVEYVRNCTCSVSYGLHYFNLILNNNEFTTVLFNLVFLCNVLRCIILFFFSFFSFLFWSLYFVPFFNVRLLVTFCFSFWVLTRHNYNARSTNSTLSINSPTNCCSNCFLSSTVNKMKNRKYHTLGRAQKSYANRRKRQYQYS